MTGKRYWRAGNLGFCFGVQRTVRMAQEILRRTGRLTSIGDLVHNPQVMDGLIAQGLKVVSSPNEVGPGDFLIRSHGLDPGTISLIVRKGVTVHDGVCPLVRKLHTLIARLDREGFSVIIVGDRAHPEVRACIGFGRRVVVCPPAGPVPRVRGADRVAVAGQTTLTFGEHEKAVRAVIDRVSAPCLRVFNTICRVTEQRQSAAQALSARVDAVLVLGGRRSANTRKLYEVCRSVNPRTFHVESLNDLAGVPLTGVRKIGLTSGTSTAEECIRAVEAYLQTHGYEEGSGYA